MHTFIGLLAGALTTGCWLPQLKKSWQTRSTADLSWAYLAVFSTGIALWMSYGALTSDLAIILTNGLTLTLTFGMVVMKLVFESPARRRRAEAPADSTVDLPT